MEPGALARHADALATVRAFGERAAARHVALLPEPGGVLVEWSSGGELAVTEDDDERLEIPPGSLGGGWVRDHARPLPDLRPPPATALSMDITTGELSAPIGTVGHLADAVLALARSFGGRSVASAEWATADPTVPITIAGRDGDPPMLVADGQQFSLEGSV